MVPIGTYIFFFASISVDYVIFLFQFSLSAVWVFSHFISVWRVPKVDLKMPSFYFAPQYLMGRSPRISLRAKHQKKKKVPILYGCHKTTPNGLSYSLCGNPTSILNYSEQKIKLCKWKKCGYCSYRISLEQAFGIWWRIIYQWSRVESKTDKSWNSFLPSNEDGGNLRENWWPGKCMECQLTANMRMVIQVILKHLVVSRWKCARGLTLNYYCGAYFYYYYWSEIGRCVSA